MRKPDQKQQRPRALRRLGLSIARLRTAKGWSQKEFALKLGRGINSVSRWENGTQEMGIFDACAIAQNLGTTVATLLGEAVEIPTHVGDSQLDTLDEGLDLLDRSRRLLQKDAIHLIDESRRLFEQLRSDRSDNPT